MRASRLIATVLSVMFVALGALWVRSFFVGESVTYAGKILCGLWWTRGQLAVSHVVVRPDVVARYAEEFGWRYNRGPPKLIPGFSPRFDRFGFMYWNHKFDPPSNTWTNACGICVPIWFMMLCVGSYPAFCFRRGMKERREQFRVSRQLCVRCGYDLRATPDRCPECGVVPAR
jgi:hypothetical protein